MGTKSSSAEERLPGLKLPDRYRLGRHIATGGMASVWCAEDLVLGRPVAIKVISERFARDHDAVARFEREARTAARVSGHPHVVTIYDVGEAMSCEAGASPTPRTFIVMEHLAGGTVADALRVGEVRLQEALRWLREASSALDHAHASGIVHRDIKPANFLLDGARVLHVADFGIARLGGEDTITGSGELFGTAAYLSPEQALGGAASPASDRYALAVAAYELLVGQRPFNAAHFTAQARQHIEQPPPAASERNRVLPPAVDAVLQRGLAKAPEARYATAAAFVDGLDAALRPSRPRVARRRVSTANGRSGPATGATRRATAANQRSVPAIRAARASGDTAEAEAQATRALATGVSGRASGPSAGAVIPPSDPEQLPGADGADGGAGDGARQRVAGGVDGNRRRRRAIALGALATAALGVGALAAGTQGGGHGMSAAGAGARARDTHLASRTPARRARPHTSPATTPGQTADTLEARGHELMLDGAYSAAIPTLRQAVSVAPPQSLTYGYALYDLGRSLVLSGNPRAAVPILERRLLIPNQTQVVQQMLQLALRDSSGGTGVSSSSSSSTTTASSTSTSTTGAPPPTTTTTTTITAPIPHPGGPARSDTGSGGAGLGVAPGAVTHAHAQDQRAREQGHRGHDHRTAARERRARRASAHHHDRGTGL